MKYKLLLDLKADTYLREWAAENKRFAVGCPPLASDYELIFEKAALCLFVHKRLYGFQFQFKEDSELIAKGKIELNTDGDTDYNLAVNLSEKASNLSQEVKSTILSILKGYIATFLHANAFLMYGNILNEKEYIAAGRNEGVTKVITFRKFKNKVYAVHTSAHKSPEGVFSVRGHFRHYKDGKVVWIDSYMKGIEKDG